jgi:membrane associated rhomboid family serine protease
MIPLADENPSGKKPYVVYVLIALNVLVYIVDVLGTRVYPNGMRLSGLWYLSMVPYSVIHDVRVMPIFNQFGQVAAVRELPGVWPNPQWITVFTSMFMHGGLLHIGGNMLYLWIFGNNIEDAVGHAKFLLFYLACGVLAALAHIYSDPNSVIPTVGASGAIAGVLGAYLYLYPGNRVRTLVMLGFFWDYVEVPALLVLGVWFLTQLMNLGGSGGLRGGGGVAYWAHVGGFVAGVILILLLGGRKLTRRHPPRRYYSRFEV